MSRPSRHGIEEAKSPRDRRRCEQRWDYRHSKKSDRVFRKLNALALPGSAATGNLSPAVSHGFEGSTPFFGTVRVWQELIDISRSVRNPLSAFDAN
jgi:hypothetical protein